ncbi:MAG: F0F1 ATP synthase subunit epsilon [Gammaproteobacteria bacterium]|jgi:F-type H+-transporting ATPase subunit epsilon
MKHFSLRLLHATGSETIDNVTSFVGEDASGSFGILAGHARMMTTLVTGLARFQDDGKSWRYLALPGALLYFHDNLLTLGTRRYLLDEDYSRISQALQEQLLAEERQLRAMKESLHRMEEEIIKRLWAIGRGGMEI